MEVKPSLCFGGKYPSASMRHRNSNRQTLKELAEILGYPIEENPILADIYISLDYNEENIEVLKTRKIANKLNVLFRNEPRCVLPAGYSRTALNLNNIIITFGKPHKDSISEVWPQFWDETLFLDDNLARNSTYAVMVNANKLNLAKGELYTLRRKSISNIINLDIFGDGWNSSITNRFKVALIEIRKNPIRNLFAFSFHSRHWFTRRSSIIAPDDKGKVLRRYKVSLVIENELTYLSEKLFDALAAGCVPVYVGPEVSEYGIPSSLVFQAKPNVCSIEKQIKLAIESDYSIFRRELAGWLNSSEVKGRHQGENVIKRALEKSVEEFQKVANLSRK